jgi:hypothetical protein
METYKIRAEFGILWGVLKQFLNRQAPYEQSEEYVICGLFLLPFS